MRTLPENAEKVADADGIVSYDATDLGLEDFGFVDEVAYRVDEGVAHVAIEVTEDLDFHAKLETKFPSKVQLFLARENPDEPAESTDEAWTAAHEVFEKRYKADLREEEGGVWRITFSVQVPADMGEHMLGNICYDALRRFANERDPGTFGAEYLYSVIAKHIQH